VAHRRNVNHSTIAGVVALKKFIYPCRLIESLKLTLNTYLNNPKKLCNYKMNNLKKV